MLYTQIEVTSPQKEKEVWWIPVPAGKTKIGEQIMHQAVHWTITGVYVTIPDTSLPPGCRKADKFKRFSRTEAIISI